MLDFPASPSDGQQFHGSNGALYQWRSPPGLWQSVTTPLLPPVPSTGGTVNARDYGAVGDGLADDTSAIQAALSTGHAVFLPSGRYRVTDMLSMSYGGCLFGETKRLTKIVVPTTFNLAALGVIRIASELSNPTPTDYGNENAGTILDLQIDFDQPDTAVRANLIAYPPAIYATSAGRFIVSNVRIVRAQIGIWMPGNAGAAMIDCLEASCFSKAIWIDENLDCTHLSRIHLWCFGLTPNQLLAWQDGTTIGLEVGRADGLVVTDFFAINQPKGIWLRNSDVAGSSIPPSFGNLTNIMLDDSGLVVENGTWNVSNLYMAPGVVTARTLVVAGSFTQPAYVNVTGLYQRHLTEHSSGIVESILVGGTANANARLNITGMVSTSFAHDRTHIKVQSGAGANARLNLANAQFERNGNTSPINPTIHIASGRAELSNLTSSDKGTGTGTFIRIDTDDWIAMSNIYTLGWGVTVPANARFIEHDILALTQAFTPAVAAHTGTLGAGAVANGFYRRRGRYLNLFIKISIPNNGTGSVGILVGLPTGFTSAQDQPIFGRDSTTTGKVVFGWIPVSGASLLVQNYDATYPAASGSVLNLNGTLEIQ